MCNLTFAPHLLAAVIVCLSALSRPPNVHAMDIYEKVSTSEDLSWNICVKANEEFKCGYCQMSCADLGHKCDRDPQEKCVYGCYCQKGYVRATEDKTSTCIPQEDCFRQVNCPRSNEIFTCGGPCQVRCDNLGQKCNQSGSCHNDCYCMDGYARKTDDKSECIRLFDCLH